MDFRQFRYFVAVADELHVGKAAEKLGIAQPALSQQIQQLERQLDVTLFSRKSRRLQLTEEGMFFLSEARMTLRQADHAIQAVKRLGRGESGHIKLGYVDSAMLGAALPAALQRFRAAHPHVELDLTSSSVTDQIKAITLGTLDAVVVRGMLPLMPRELVCTEFAREELLVCLPQAHPLAAGPAVEAVSLRDEAFITPVDPSGIGLAGQISQICQEAGFMPRVAQRAGQTATIASLVANGFGVALLPEQLQRVKLPNLVFRPLQQPAWSRLYLIVSAAERRLVLEAFLRSCSPQ